MTISTQDKTQKETRAILIIDGFNMFIKHYMVNETVTSNGVLVGGVIGFIKSLNALVRDFAPQKVIICWENGGGSPRRLKILETYKTNRTSDKKMFKEIKREDDRKWIQKDANNRAQQMQILINCLKHLPVCQLYVQNTEADDLIAYVTKYKFAAENCKKIIISSDKDFYQLLEDKNVLIYDTTRKNIIDKKKVLEVYDIAPNSFALAKSFVGDESDNIDGIEGLGFKTLVKRFPNVFNDETKDYNIDDIIEMAKKEVEAGSKIKVYSNIIDGRLILERNWKLIYLGTSSIPANQIQKIDYAIDTFVPKMDKLSLIKGMITNYISTDIDFDSLSSNMKMTLCSG